MSARESGDEILIVDDDPRDSEALAAAFRAGGFRVTTFEDGDLFIGAARARPAACLIVDVNMPERSGLEILKMIDAANHDALVVVLSGVVTVPIAVEAVKLGAFDVIEKAFDPQVIVEHRIIRGHDTGLHPVTETAKTGDRLLSAAGLRQVGLQI